MWVEKPELITQGYYRLESTLNDPDLVKFFSMMKILERMYPDVHPDVISDALLVCIIHYYRDADLLRLWKEYVKGHPGNAPLTRIQKKALLEAYSVVVHLIECSFIFNDDKRDAA